MRLPPDAKTKEKNKAKNKGVRRRQSAICLIFLEIETGLKLVGFFAVSRIRIPIRISGADLANVSCEKWLLKV